MLSFLLALLSAAGTVINFVAIKSFWLQVLVVAIAVLSMIVYRGGRTRKSYEHDGTRIFTLRFAFNVLCFMGALGLLIGWFFGLE